ncbi:MAG: hypothetical protein EA405_09255 [Rhodospirillales bacterium]|nr:MAG: hypothetical protein EA405_09255 [Rhodospirillales bacterium]
MGADRKRLERPPETANPLALTPAQIHPLETQDFDRHPPGTVLQDFEALLNGVGDQGLPVTSTHLLTMNVLAPLNQALTHPLDLRLKRPQQKSYPPLNGLYLLLRATGLGVVHAQRKTPRLTLDPEGLASWRSLNGTERYFALLKAWWGRAREETIGERAFGGGEILAKTLAFIERFPTTGTLTIGTPRDAEMLRYYPGLHNLALLESFGLLEVRVRPPTEGQGWQPEWIRLSEWGQIVLGSYTQVIRHAVAPESGTSLPTLGFMGHLDPLEGFESWRRLVQPHISGWRQDLEIPEPPFQPGPHVFKVALGADCWRRMALRGDSSLAELAATILNAFRFDHDHLYRFSYRDRFGRPVEIDSPDFLEGNPDHAFADEVAVGALPLSQGMRIGFLYDFGDQWEFVIEIESLNSGPAIKKPQVLEKHGQAPPQYGGW